MDLRDANILFVCHGRMHRRYTWLANIPRETWNHATYIDQDPSSLPDIAAAVTEVPRQQHCQTFDAVVAIHCPLTAYVDVPRRRLLQRFFDNVAAWLRPNGVFITTGVPTAFEDVMSPSKMRANDLNAALTWLLAMKFSQDEDERHQYDDVRQHLVSVRRSSPLLKRLDAVKTRRQYNEHVESTQVRPDEASTRAFIRAVERVSQGRLKHATTTPMFVAFRRSTAAVTKCRSESP